jgi:hypothetical protein
LEAIQSLISDFRILTSDLKTGSFIRRREYPEQFVRLILQRLQPFFGYQLSPADQLLGLLRQRRRVFLDGVGEGDPVVPAL